MNLYKKAQLADNEPVMRAICDSKNIVAAWLKVAQNNGCAGVDEVTIDQFAANIEDNLINLQEELITSTYQPSPLLRFYVSKDSGDSRALSIPTVRDRVAQQAATAVLTPILDATFEECSFGYRKGKGRRQALMEIISLHKSGYRYVLDADIEDFFDNIDHFLLVQRLAELIPEESVMRLVASWLTVDIKDGNRVYKLTKGVPQGSSLSPLLSNLYLDLFDKVMVEQGYKLIRYCDDFVVLTKQHALAVSALNLSEYLLGQLKLNLKNEKTQIVTFEQGFRYLGVTFKGEEVLTEGLDNIQLTEKNKMLESTIQSRDVPDLLQKFGLMDEEDSEMKDNKKTVPNQSSEFVSSPTQPNPSSNDNSSSTSVLVNALSNNGHKKEEALSEQIEPNESQETETDSVKTKTSVSEHESLIAQQLREMHSAIQQLRQTISSQEDGEDEPIAKESKNHSFSTSRLLSTLYLSEQGSYLCYSQKRLIVKKDNEVIMEIPAIKIQQIVVLGKCGITTPALDFCLKAGISISFLSVHGNYYGRIVPPTARQVTLHQLQFQKNADMDFALRMAKSFVDGKIHNQRVLLQRRYWREDSSELEGAIQFLGEMQNKAKQATTLDELRGYEGTSTAGYFRAFGQLIDSSFSFSKRIKHPPKDPVNALLSFGYTLLFQNIYSLVETHGLHPYCGYLHAIRDGHPALVSDLIEEFRVPVVDSLVIYLINSHIIKPDDFEKKETTKPCWLSNQARKAFIHHFENKIQSTVTHTQTNYTVDYRRIIDLQITELVQCIREERETYRPMKLR